MAVPFLAQSQSCSPAAINPVFSSPTAGFNPTPGTAVPISVKITDDCNNPVTTGTVTANFSDGTAAIPLTNAGAGVWTGNWTTSSAQASSVVLRVDASVPTSNNTPFGVEKGTNTGSAILTGSVGADPLVPLVFSGGVVSAAAPGNGNTAAPGSFVSIYGRGLADAQVGASALPFPPSLGGVSVQVDGKPIPLVFVSDGQINGILPFDIGQNSSHSVTVTRNGKTSQSGAITVNPVAPAVFTTNSGGTGQGIVVNNTTGKIADQNSPVRAGDAVIIYCAGLGPVTGNVVAGTASPASPLSYTSYTVNVSIGGYPAPVIFAGLTPGFASLYQVNAIVPSGVPTGNAVSLQLSSVTGAIIGPASPIVTIAVTQ